MCRPAVQQPVHRHLLSLNFSGLNWWDYSMRVPNKANRGNESIPKSLTFGCYSVCSVYRDVQTDFWCLKDNPFVVPVGICRRNGWFHFKGIYICRVSLELTQLCTTDEVWNLLNYILPVLPNQVKIPSS